MEEKWDFSGWATKNDLKCSDGRTIRRDAFKDNDGQIVPLVWNHDHKRASNVLGHALLKNEPAGVRAYGKFNSTPEGQNAKEIVRHGDIVSLSIYANKLVQNGGDVLHGMIREVSLVLAGANEGARIDFPILAHTGEELDTEAIIYADEPLELAHAEEKKVAEPEPAKEEPAAEKGEEKKMAENEKTVKDVFDSLSEEQKKVVYFMIGKAVEEAKNESKGEDADMKHNVFEGDNEANTLVHNEMTQEEMMTIIGDAKRFGSMKESFLAHAEEYGIENIEYLFPDAKTLQSAPDFIKRNDEWVNDFMKNAKHSPFSRVKSIFANITEDDARAKGYLKGNMKKEEVFPLLKRVTTPTTVYKKQKLDRDDIVDITDFDVVAWLKTEMRMMLDEEIAVAGLLGDGRDASSDDKINPLNIRPVWGDDALYSVNKLVTVASTATDDDIAKAFIRTAIKARKDYKGSGNPILFTTEDMLSDMLLLTKTTGEDLYDSEEQLSRKLRVRKIATCTPMENRTRTVDGVTHTLLGIILNPVDYNYGADKGGAVAMFDDFDIDYNQQKYLIETRCSGALVKPYSAIVIEKVVSNG